MSTITIINSRRYLDPEPEIVADKIANEDFTAQVSPVFEVDGDKYRVVLDGDYSIAAAREAGAPIEWEEQTSRENDTIAMLERGEIEDFRTVNYGDSEYYDIATGKGVW